MEVSFLRLNKSNATQLYHRVRSASKISYHQRIFEKSKTYYLGLARINDFLLDSRVLRTMSDLARILNLLLPFRHFKHHFVKHIDFRLRRRNLVQRDHRRDLFPVLVIFPDGKHCFFFWRVENQLGAFLGTMSDGVTADDRETTYRSGIITVIEYDVGSSSILIDCDRDFIVHIPSMIVLGSSPGFVPRPSILTNTSMDEEPV